jgi:hypothetical protein
MSRGRGRRGGHTRWQCCSGLTVAIPTPVRLRCNPCVGFRIAGFLPRISFAIGLRLRECGAALGVPRLRACASGRDGRPRLARARLCENRRNIDRDSRQLLILAPARHHPAQDCVQRQQQLRIGGSALRVEEDFRRRGAELSKGDAHRARRQLRSDERAGDVDPHMLGGLLAQRRLDLRRQEIGDRLERDGDAIRGRRRGLWRGRTGRRGRGEASSYIGLRGFCRGRGLRHGSPCALRPESPLEKISKEAHDW